MSVTGTHWHENDRAFFKVKKKHLLFLQIRASGKRMEYGDQQGSVIPMQDSFYLMQSP
jgi:hypothetical protein